ncbi:MAG: PilZ domain-containing protein [Polyangiaceae bacterium]|nr:PilZ domain-containing protein [Polyangiaceae bacterium]
MERRNAARMMVDIPAWCLLDGHRHPCRAVDLSATGMLISRSRAFSERDLPQLGAYEMFLGSRRPIRFRARTVRCEGPLVAVRFVVMNDADRLSIAEHADELARRRISLH